MIIELKAWVFGVLAALLLFFGVAAGVLFYHNHKIKEELATERQKVESYKYNTEGKVKAAANNFIKAYMEMDSSQHQTTEERIKPYTTSEARKKVVPPGEGEIVSKVKITSQLSNTKLYYSSIAPNKASVFVQTTRAISVDKGQPTKSQEMLQLELKLIKGKWIVNDIQVLSQSDSGDLEAS